MAYRFLVDECLSPALVRLAIESGHVESTCVRDQGWSGTKDWRLVELAIKSDFTLVTHNSVDFRGKRGEMPAGHYALQSIHAGLVCLNSVFPMAIARQTRLFKHVLMLLCDRPDLINAALEIFEYEDGSVAVDVYDIPGPVS